MCRNKMDRLKKYLPYLLYSCKKISELIDKDDEVLTLKEKVILLYHGTLCRSCYHYKSQTKTIDDAIIKSFDVSTTNPQLSEEKKISIIKIISEGKA
jgi:hypothetical protein